MKLSGFGFSFLLAFLLTFGLTKSTKDKFLENKNAIYGFEFNSIMEEFGFQDGMKIKSINGNVIDRTSSILTKILTENGNIELSVEKNGIQNKIIISDADKIKLMQNPKEKPIVPIIYDSNGKNEVIVTTSSYSFSDVLDRFGTLWNQALIIINPNQSSYKGIGGFKTLSKNSNFKSYISVLSLSLIILGILNMLPLPGFSLGVFLISVIETLRRNLFNQKRKRAIGLLSIILVVVILGIRIFA